MTTSFPDKIRDDGFETKSLRRFSRATCEAGAAAAERKQSDSFHSSQSAMELSEATIVPHPFLKTMRAKTTN
jgi:predicted GNAT superfamily acetyltransferase